MVALSVIAAKDGLGATIAGGLQALDKASTGVGTGPFTLGQVLIDGAAGVNVAAVSAAGALKVDGSAVTQPISGSVSISGTAAVTQSGTWTVQPGNTPNTVAWKVDGSAVTQPVSGTVTSRIVGNGGAVVDFAGQNAAQPANSILIGGEFNTAPTTITNGNASPLQLDSTGKLLASAAQLGTWSIRNLGNAGAILDFAGQNASAPANAFLIGGEFNTSPTTITSGNASPLQLDNAGKLLTRALMWDGTNNVTVRAASTGPAATTDTAVVVSVRDALAAIGGANPIGGATASNVAPTENPILLGAIGLSAEPSAITTTRKSQLFTDLVGKLIVLPYANPENFISATSAAAITDTADHTILAAPGAGLRNYVTSVIISNAHATVDTDVVIKDGTAGTVLATFPAAHAEGGVALSLPVPIRQPTANTLICAADLTTGASVKVTLIGYKGA